MLTSTALWCGTTSTRELVPDRCSSTQTERSRAGSRPDSAGGKTGAGPRGLLPVRLIPVALVPVELGRGGGGAAAAVAWTDVALAAGGETRQEKNYYCQLPHKISATGKRGSQLCSGRSPRNHSRACLALLSWRRYLRRYLRLHPKRHPLRRHSGHPT